MVVHRSILDDSPADQVYWRELTGRPDDVEARLNRKVGALARHGAFHRKIGITNDPCRRWGQGYRPNGWVQMHVVYRSSSHANVCELERRIVTRFGDQLMMSPGLYWNAVGGGGGRKPLVGPYYLYLVTAPKFARLST